MSEADQSTGRTAPPASGEEQSIQDRVRELTSQMLRQGRVDTEGVREVVRAVSGRDVSKEALVGAEARAAFADAVRGLDEALQSAATATHMALDRLASKGRDFTENDLKNSLDSLKQLQHAYVATANRLAGAASESLGNELTALAVHAQKVGAQASARVATTVSEFAGRMRNLSRDSAATGFETARTVSVRMALLTSGILAGVADALRQQSEAKKDE